MAEESKPIEEEKKEEVKPTEPIAKVEEVVEKHAETDTVATLRKEFDDKLIALESRLAPKKEKKDAIPAKEKVEPAPKEEPTEPKPKPAAKRPKFKLWRTL
jgi:hypothetical protein